jgi:hypothetical protein
MAPLWMNTHTNNHKTLSFGSGFFRFGGIKDEPIKQFLPHGPSPDADGFYDIRC